MQKQNLKIALKSNSNIIISVVPEFCNCGRPMFLKKNGGDGGMFWSCKGYSMDENLKSECDLTRDVKCFVCKKGEMRSKMNSLTGEIFYGCSNFSKVSKSGCNFTISDLDAEDLINQVNQALRFQYDFKSISLDPLDEIKWKDYQELNNVSTGRAGTLSEGSKKGFMDTIGGLLGISQNKSSEENKSEEYEVVKGRLNFPITLKMQKIAASGILFIALVAVFMGSGVEMELFQGMFKLKVGPSKPTSSNISLEYDAKTGQLKIENKSTNEKIDLGAVDLKDVEGNTIVDFGTLPKNQQILEKGQTVVMTGDDLAKMAEDIDADVIPINDNGGVMFNSNSDLPEYTPGSTEGNSDIKEDIKTAISNNQFKFVVEGSQKNEELKMDIKNRFDDFKSKVSEKEKDIVNKLDLIYGQDPEYLLLKEKYRSEELTLDDFKKVFEEDKSPLIESPAVDDEETRKLPSLNR